MRGRAIAIAILSLGLWPAGASGSTQIGQLFEPTLNCSPATRLQTTSPNSVYAAPTAGVITSWTFQSSNGGGAGPINFKVARSAGGDNYTIVAQSELKQIPGVDQLNTFSAQIPVKAGDVIGLDTSPPSVFLCLSTAPGYAIERSTAFPGPGTTATFTPVSDQQLALAATLEPDCDSDGFGDETQDTDIKSCKDSKFSFGKLKRNKAKGTAKLTVKVPGPGALTLAGKGLVKQQRAAAGAVKLRIKPKGHKKAKLEDAGKVKLKAKVTYTPTGGLANTKKKPVKLVLAD